LERLASDVPQYAGDQKKLKSRELPVVIVERAEHPSGSGDFQG
jgi:hypothetical protein